jgi:hypothetical protein
VRDTFASLLIARCLDVVFVSRQRGHSDLDDHADPEVEALPSAAAGTWNVFETKP